MNTRWAATLVWAALSLPPVTVVAQTASDTELRAAYCMGVANQRLEALKTIAQSFAPNSATRAPVDNRITGETAERDRLRDYLLSKGYLTTDRDPLPIAIAQRRAASDANDCVNSTTPQQQLCAANCLKTPDAEACVEKCAQPASCQRVQQCDHMDKNMPF